MRQLFQYYLPLYASVALLTIIPQEYMPKVDAFSFVLEHQDLLPAPEPRQPEFAISQVKDYVNVR